VARQLVARQHSSCLGWAMKPDHRPELDGLRALAVLLVVAHHSGLVSFRGGAIGVDLFFVLSGYLITGILINGIGLADFYARRARRIVPALLLLCAAYAAAAPFIPPAVFARPWMDLAGALTFSHDYLIPRVDGFSGLGHTWSLAVEMQFYLLWPFVIGYLRRRPTAMAAIVFAAIYLTIAALRIIEFQRGWEFANFQFHTHAGGLVLGSALAFFPQLQRNSAPMTSGLCALTVIGALTVFAGDTSSWRAHRVLWGTSTAEIAAAVLVTALLQPSPLQTAFRWKPAQVIGVLSYGIYLWHFPIAMGLRGIAHHGVRLLASSVGGTIAAAISYHTVEAVFRRRPRSSVLATPAAA